MVIKGDRIAFYKKAICLALILAVVLTLGRAYAVYYSTRNSLQPPLPFGVELERENHYYVYRDFPLVMAFCRQVWAGTVERPYSLAGQERFFRQWLPAADRGLNVAYAPTILLWTWPLTFLCAEGAYLLMSLVNAAVLFALLRGFLFPRTANLPHLLLIGLGLYSVSFLSCLAAAHNPILSCGLIALAWNWIGKGTVRESGCGWGVKLERWKEVALALVLFGLSAKPHVALQLGCLFLAAGLWRPVVAAAVAFAVSAWALSPWLGGWPVWLWDYLSFVGRHSQKEMGAFLYFGSEQSSNLVSFLEQVTAWPQEWITRLDGLLWLGGLAVFLGLCRAGRLGLRDYFVLSYTWFFLFSPSLAPSEDWVMVLLVAEAPLFRQDKSRVVWVVTALLLFAALNLKQVPGMPLAAVPLLFPAKFLLFALAWTWRRRCGHD
jgi:hypothetical protein